MDDDELIMAAARVGDTALRALSDRHPPWLPARPRTALPPPDVEDVRHDTFLAVWRGSGGYRPGSGARWPWGIARRPAALWLRRRTGGTPPGAQATAQVVVLSVKVAGRLLVPGWLARNPKLAAVPGAMAAFQPASVIATAAPVCV
ncbi:MAG: hypothetical protein V7603_6454 [Micromonosporaceae bacterium]